MDQTDSDAVANELNRGEEVGRKLLAHIDSGCCSIETCRQLTLEMMSSFEKSILIVTSNGAAIESKQLVASCPNSGGTESPRSLKRKTTTMRKWSSRVRLGSVEDGYNWRKYGQKDILGTKNPRGYYRCSHRHSQGCPATKQVQKSDEDPSLFDVTYRGTHTCQLKVIKAIPAAALHEKQDMLLSLQTGLKVKTEGLDFSFPSSTPVDLVKAEKVNFSPSSTLDNSFAGTGLFVSPATSDQSNYFPRRSFGAVAESESADTSASNFPLLDMDFLLDLDKDFQFDPSFLSENF